MKRAGEASTQAERYQLYHQAEALLNEASPVIPLYHYSHTRLVKPELKGFPDNNPKEHIRERPVLRREILAMTFARSRAAHHFKFIVAMQKAMLF